MIHKTSNGRIIVAASLAGAALLLLAGCSSSGAASNKADGDKAANVASEKFVACLQKEGISGRVSDAKGAKGVVLVKDINIQIDDSNGSFSISSEDTGQGSSPLLFESDDAGNTWVGAQDSSYFTNDQETRDAYETCEKKYPDFSQPMRAPEEDPEFQEILKQQKESALAFTQCARKKGFSWIEDPDSESSAVKLPEDTSEEEFRALLDACNEKGSMFPWDFGSDKMKFEPFDVLRDYMDEGSATIGGSAE